MIHSRRKTAAGIVLDVSENSHRTEVKFSVKLSTTDMGFVNYSGLKLCPDFQNTEELSRGVLQK